MSLQRASNRWGQILWMIFWRQVLVGSVLVVILGYLLSRLEAVLFVKYEFAIAPLKLALFIWLFSYLTTTIWAAVAISKQKNAQMESKS